MAHRSLVDAHICVDPRISVSEGHRIAETTRTRVLDSHSTVSDVLVHVDVEDDLDHDSASQTMPERSELIKQLTPLLAGLPGPERVVLHYLSGGVEAEVFLPQVAFGDLAAISRAEREIGRRLAEQPLVRSLSISYRRRVFPAADD